MIIRTFAIHNPSGLHIRPAGVLAAGIGGFESDITILCGDRQYNAKSIIHVLSAGIGTGALIQVRVEGADEEQAMAKVAELIESGLGE